LSCIRCGRRQPGQGAVVVTLEEAVKQIVYEPDFVLAVIVSFMKHRRTNEDFSPRVFFAFLFFKRFSFRCICAAMVFCFSRSLVSFSLVILNRLSLKFCFIICNLLQ
jgi:hypothetical protein